MATASCKDCKPPTRYPGCSAKCPVGLEREARKRQLYKERLHEGTYRQYMIDAKRKLMPKWQGNDRRQGDK